MGRGSRHSKNAGTMGSEALSYAEKKAMGYGTFKERLGSDSMGNYNDCCLSLHPVVDPVVTQEGYLYSKESILESLLSQKKTIKRKRSAWEASQKEEADLASEKADIEQQSEVLAFDRANHMGISQGTVDNIKAAITTETATLHGTKMANSVIAISDNRERMKTLKSNWALSLAPAEKITVEKPDTDTICPASGKKLKMKDLIPVKFTPAPLEEGKGKYMDPVTKDTFKNVDKLVVIKPTGDVLLKSTYEKLFKKEGVYDGHTLGAKDVIELQTGGSGFVGRSGDKVQAQRSFIVGAGSGRQDLRGQMGGARSLGGLQIHN